MRFPLLQSIIVEFNRHFFANCRVNIAIMIQLELFQYLFGSELFWDTVENLGSIVPSYPYCSHRYTSLMMMFCIDGFIKLYVVQHYRPTIHEKKAAILILNAYYESIETSMVLISRPLLALMV